MCLVTSCFICWHGSLYLHGKKLSNDLVNACLRIVSMKWKPLYNAFNSCIKEGEIYYVRPILRSMDVVWLPLPTFENKTMNTNVIYLILYLIFEFRLCISDTALGWLYSRLYCMRYCLLLIVAVFNSSAPQWNF